MTTQIFIWLERLLARRSDAIITISAPLKQELLARRIAPSEKLQVIELVWTWRDFSRFEGDQAHLSHRLVRMGMAIRQAVFFNYLMAFMIAVNALLIINSRILHSFIAVFLAAVLVATVRILMSTQARGANGHGNGYRGSLDHQGT